MKKYNFKKAFDFIEKNKEKIKEASLGMNEDWSWTADTIFENGEFTQDLSDDKLEICGINASTWATPTLEIVYKNDIIERMGCYLGKSDSNKLVEIQKKSVNGDGPLARPKDDPEFNIKKNL